MMMAEMYCIYRLMYYAFRQSFGYPKTKKDLL